LCAKINSVHKLFLVAKTIENKKIEIIFPVDNLFFVGDCTKAPGIGINCNVKSAQILADILKNYK